MFRRTCSLSAVATWAWNSRRCIAGLAAKSPCCNKARRFHLNLQIARVEKQGSVRVQLHDGSLVTGSHLMVATGRGPTTGDLGLDRTGVQTNNRGFIQVDDKLHTTAEGIWALGDVTGGPQFTHISYNDFQIIYANVYQGKSLSTRDRLLPYAVYTDPTLGRVGMTETEARAQGRKIKTGFKKMSTVARAIERGETAGFMKLVVEAETEGSDLHPSNSCGRVLWPDGQR
jgi:pyruvate/2-oxoglutarate dehydrogenase complex dihydrolipoamide dehydrogenase (E3) component